MICHRALGALVVERIPDEVALAARGRAHSFNVNVRCCDVGLAGRIYVVIVGQLRIVSPGVEKGGYVTGGEGCHSLTYFESARYKVFEEHSIEEPPRIIVDPCRRSGVVRDERGKSRMR